MTSCVAFANVPSNLTIRRLSTFSSSSEASSFSWGDELSNGCNNVPLTPLTPVFTPSTPVTPIRSCISSNKSKIGKKSLCECGKCPVLCWLERLYRNISGKSLTSHESCKRCKSKERAVLAKKTKVCSSLNGSASTIRCIDECSVGNLSWDASADFLESFQGHVPYRTLKVVSSSPMKESCIVEEDGILEDDFQDIDISEESERFSLISWNHSEPKIVPVIIRGRDIPDARRRVQVPVAVLAVDQQEAKIGLQGGHRRLERLKEDVAEVRSQIEEALRLCKQVEVELKDMRSSSSVALNEVNPRASWIKSSLNQRWERNPAKNIPCLTSSSSSANKKSGIGCHVCCNDVWGKPKWEKTFVEHRVFVEEMKYHFRWQRGMAH